MVKANRRAEARSGSDAGDANGSGADDDVDKLISGLTRFLLLHSAEGAFEVRDTVRAVGRAYGTQAEILAIAEGAVLTIRHPDGRSYHDTVRVGPDLTRLDLVTKAKSLVNRILAGKLSAAAACQELTGLESSREPYPWWLRIIGVTLFAVGFAPGVQQTWREVAAAAVLGAVMGVMFIAADWVLAHSLVVPAEGETGATAAVFVAATVLAFAAGALEQFRNLPPRGVTILAGFFALTVGAVALRGLTLLAGNPRIQGFNNIRDATEETIGLTLGLITGAVAAAAIAAYRRRTRPANEG